MGGEWWGKKMFDRVGGRAKWRWKATQLHQHDIYEIWEIDEKYKINVL